VSSGADFIAGNTRLRARLPALLGGVDYDQLTTITRPAAVERLFASIYRSDPHPDTADDRVLLDVVGRRLRRLLRDVRGLYVGTAGAVVDILLARHDLHDTLALLRGARNGQPASERLAAVMGVGVVNERNAVDIAAADDGATTSLRLAAHRLPDAPTARKLRAAWDRYELNSDQDELESTIASAAIGGWTCQLARAGRAARPVLRLVHAECDVANLLAVLRRSAPHTPRLLPIGLLTRPALLAAWEGDLTGVAAARPDWTAALDQHARRPDLPALEWDLQLGLWKQAVRGLRRGDPLGADVPVGYVVAVECEARVVRLVLADRADRRDVRDLLVR
jgi:hypothetical protein